MTFWLVYTDAAGVERSAGFRNAAARARFAAGVTVVAEGVR